MEILSQKKAPQVLEWLLERLPGNTSSRSGRRSLGVVETGASCLKGSQWAPHGQVLLEW